MLLILNALSLQTRVPAIFSGIDALVFGLGITSTFQQMYGNQLKVFIILSPVVNANCYYDEC